MNIKSLLLGSAAALAVVSGANAADAIVAAEPEPMEYVRVCDAMGTGFFYIPGTETCLKIGGEVAFKYNWRNPDAGDFSGEFLTEANVSFEAKNDSELGTIGSFIKIKADSDNTSVSLDKAYITVGGFKAGYTATYWDDIGISGETDSFAAFTKGDMISYTYSSDAFSIGAGIDELSNVGFDDLGVEVMASAKLGAASISVFGVYDLDAQEGAVAAKLSAEVGPGSIGIYGAYSTGDSAYVVGKEWTVGAAYDLKATDKLTLTPAVNYHSPVLGADYFTADFTAAYALADGLKASANVQYYDNSGDWKGFVKLVRSF